MTMPASTTPDPVLFVPSGAEAPGGLPERTRVEEIRAPEDIDTGDIPTLLFLPSPPPWEAEEIRDLPRGVVLLTRGEGARNLASRAGRVFLPLPDDDVSSGGNLASLLDSAACQSAALQALARAHSEMREISKVGMALMSERDPDELLGMILTQARRLTSSDAGSLYLVEENEDGEPCLHFRLTQNDSLPDLPNPDFLLPLDRSSIAGFVASTGDLLVIDDVYGIPEDRPYSFNESFDEQYGYRGKSQLVVPMKDHRDRIVGVLQLINRKDDPAARIRDEASARAHVLPYSERDQELVRSLAGQAAVSIENGQLYRDIENVFEGFIRAAVTAIDQRDPTTSGHSVRVTTLTCDLARAAHEATEGPFEDVFFTREEMKQLRYAGLLHDFGKVGVKEEVLVKMNKLTPVLEARVLARFDYIQKLLEAEHAQAKLDALREEGPEIYGVRQQILDRELAEALNRLDRYREAVMEANAPRVLPEEAAGILDQIAEATYTDPRGRERPYLTEEELHYLRIPRGSLDEEERKQIESHVIHSSNYLQEIPWPDDLSRIAEIVQGHHEKLDGSGYPKGVTGEEIPLETRFMTICDIFDALTASDRPYKKAMPLDKALSILRMEAEGGQLDADAVELFIESAVYEKVLKTDWREL